MLQAEDRAHRRGQKNPVNVYFLCARGTCDERHWQRISAKVETTSTVHDGPAPQIEGGARSAAPRGLVVDEVTIVTTLADEDVMKNA